ncbi:hypothetical protein [Streptomyces sp. NPDC046197]|uniref:hypothetical protein n=1 Tax=Streptomyces sp. NPDC046197 TaxID=3154337 RepID=UPI00340FC32B
MATCTELDLDVLADRSCLGAGGTGLTVHASLRAPVERTIAEKAPGWSSPVCTVFGGKGE